MYIYIYIEVFPIGIPHWYSLFVFPIGPRLDPHPSLPSPMAKGSGNLALLCGIPTPQPI